MKNGPRSEVDIAVPIYNGYDDLVRCIDSLKRHTDLTKHRVLLIDDCSPDERVRAMLRELCGERVYDRPAAEEDRSGRDACGFIAVFNEKNQGFSANVNLALAWSDRDTILLNSDTVVTRGWVEKLSACAYRSERTATVTPLSNAATLASVPVFLRDNPLPEGYTVDSYADLVERVSLHRYPRVTVGVGFCLYVRQDAFEVAGAFDAKTFGRGYGEENDFCFRCSMLGYTHVLCDDTFIYHRGTASFDTEEKKRLVEEHDRILRRRYPDMTKANDDYCREDPDREIRDNLLLHQCLDNGRRNLLYFLHLDFREVARGSIGGTQLHVRDLVQGASRDFNVFVASRDGDALRLTVYVQEPEGMPEWDVLRREESAQEDCRLISLKFPIGKEEPFPVFYDEQLAETLRGILRAFSIDLVHVHHTQGLSLDIYRVCRQMEIPVMATLHDYYYACPTTKLLRGDGQYCPQAGTFASVREQVCGRCLHENCGYGRVHVIRRWRQECLEALTCCSRILFPSESARAIMLQAFPELEARSMVIGHGTDDVGSGTVFLEDGRAPERSDRVHGRLDSMPGQDGGSPYLSGWVFLEGADSARTSILVEITDRAGSRHVMRVRRNARPDVAAAQADDRCLWSGIHAVFHVPGMPEGRYRIRLMVEEDGRLWTDGKVYSGVFQNPGGAPAGGSSAQEAPLRVAFLGGVTPAKGSKLLSDVIHSGDRRFVFYVYGEVGDPSVLEQKVPDNVHFSGVYRKDDIFDLLKVSGIDAACILPRWGETFCYTLSEAWACGIPVIGTDLGAVGERIRKTGAGWVVPPDAGRDDVIALLAKIRDDRNHLEEKKAVVKALPMKRVADMNAEYRELYMDTMRPDEGGTKTPGQKDLEDILQGLAAGNPCVKGRGQQAAMNRILEENRMLKTSMEMMQNTTSYRLARKIAEADIPFKEPLKKLLRKR